MNGFIYCFGIMFWSVVIGVVVIDVMCFFFDEFWRYL